MSGHQVQTGKRGGSYYFNGKGRKVYVTNKPSATGLLGQKAGVEMISKSEKKQLFSDDDIRNKRINKESYMSTGDPVEGRRAYFRVGDRGHFNAKSVKRTQRGGVIVFKHDKAQRAREAAYAKFHQTELSKKVGVHKVKTHKGEKDAVGHV
jgi:hypothetical protein